MQRTQTESPCRILVVDDSPAIQATVCLILKQAGYNTDTAFTGDEALTKHQANPFSLIVTDIVMPDTDGLELIQEIRRRSSNTRIIAMTGGGPMDVDLTLKVASRLGATEVLRKPFKPQELLSAVERLSAE